MATKYHHITMDIKHVQDSTWDHRACLARLAKFFQYCQRSLTKSDSPGISLYSDARSPVTFVGSLSWKEANGDNLYVDFQMGALKWTFSSQHNKMNMIGKKGRHNLTVTQIQAFYVVMQLLFKEETNASIQIKLHHENAPVLHASFEEWVSAYNRTLTDQGPLSDLLGGDDSSSVDAVAAPSHSLSNFSDALGAQFRDSSKSPGVGNHGDSALDDSLDFDLVDLPPGEVPLFELEDEYSSFVSSPARKRLAAPLLPQESQLRPKRTRQQQLPPELVEAFTQLRDEFLKRKVPVLAIRAYVSFLKSLRSSLGTERPLTIPAFLEPSESYFFDRCFFELMSEFLACPSLCDMDILELRDVLFA